MVVYGNIYDPVQKKKYNLNSKYGKKILRTYIKNYVEQLNGGSGSLIRRGLIAAGTTFATMGIVGGIASVGTSRKLTEIRNNFLKLNGALESINHITEFFSFFAFTLNENIKTYIENLDETEYHLKESTGFEIDLDLLQSVEDITKFDKAYSPVKKNKLAETTKSILAMVTLIGPMYNSIRARQKIGNFSEIVKASTKNLESVANEFAHCKADVLINFEFTDDDHQHKKVSQEEEEKLIKEIKEITEKEMEIKVKLIELEQKSFDNPDLLLEEKENLLSQLDEIQKEKNEASQLLDKSIQRNLEKDTKDSEEKLPDFHPE